MIRAVIFDIDGTLIDSVDLHAEAWRDALRHFGYDLPFDRVRAQIGKGGDQLMAALLPEEVRRRGEEIERYRLDLFKREYLPRVRAFPSVRELFQRIKADGLRIALASSAKEEELERYKQIAGIDDLLEAETSSDDAEKSKPHPDIFEAALARLGGIAAAGRRHPPRRPGRRQGRAADHRPALRRLARARPPRGRLHRDLPRPGRPPAAI
jgi:phosphoglycolate phosphatase-like HAD superfamily hydrolase